MSDLDLSIAIKGIDEFTGPAKKISNAGDVLSSKLGDGAHALRDLRGAASKIKKLGKLADDFSKMSGALKATEAEVGNYSRALDENLAKHRSVKSELDAARTSLDKSTTAVNEQNATVKKLSGQLERAREKMSRLQHEMVASEKPSAKLRREYEKSAKNVENLTETLKTEKKQLADNRWEKRQNAKVFRDAEKVYKALDSEQRKLQQSLKTTTREASKQRTRFDQQKASVTKLRSELQSAGHETIDLGKAQQKVAGQIETVTDRMNRQAKVASKIQVAQERFDQTAQRAAHISMIAGGMQNAGQRAIGVVSDPMIRMRDTERAVGQLQSLDMLDTTAVVERGRALATELAGVTTSAFVAAAYDIKSGISSLSDQGVAEMTAMATMTAKATKADIGQMTSLFATGYGTFKKNLYEGVSDDSFGEIFSAGLAQSVKQFKTDGGKMQQAIQSMGSGLAASGVSMADQFTALGMLQQKSDAGTAGTTMAALERTAAKANEKFAKMGIGVQTINSNGQMRALPDLLADMQAAFGTEYTSAVGSQIQEAFGSDEAVRFFKNLWGQQDQFRNNAQAVERAMDKGAEHTRAMARAMDGNMDAKLSVMTQRWDTVKERLGYALIPALERLIPVLEWATNGIGYLIEHGGSMPKILLAIVGGFGLLATALAPLVTGISGLATTMAWARLQTAKYRGGIARNAIAGGMDGGMGAGAGGGKKGFRARAGGVLKSGLFRGTAGLAALGGAISIGSTLMDDEMSAPEKTKSVTSQAGGLGGALAGAAAGAALGSVVPVVGTAIGGVIGSIAGGLGGEWLGGVLGDGLAGLFADDKPETTTVNQNKTVAALGTVAPVQTTGNVNSSTSNQITINAAPGMDEQALAKVVTSELDARERRRMSRQRSVLMDGVS